MQSQLILTVSVPWNMTLFASERMGFATDTAIHVWRCAMAILKTITSDVRNVFKSKAHKKAT